MVETEEAGSPQGLEVSEDWYRSSDLRARCVIGLLIIGVVVSGASLISTAFEIGLLGQISRGKTVSLAAAQASDSRQQALGIGHLVLFFLTGAAWLLWQHRAHSNLKVSGLQFTPGWAVGWWFVPFASLIKPYQAVKELRQASSGRPDWSHSVGWSVLGRWWATWVALSVS